MRKPQVKLTATVKDCNGSLIPQVIVIPGETLVCELDEAIRTALSQQSVVDYNAEIAKVTYVPGD